MNNTKANLIENAKEVMKNAYCPYSGFKVGAAILGSNDRIYTGCNVENSSFGATICAERGAMMKAVSDGCTGIKAVAIVSSSGRKTYPCGMCRQFLGEFAYENTVVILSDDEGIYEISFFELMPEYFSL